MPTKTIATLVIVAIFGIALLFSAGRLVENLDADEILIVQDPIDGELHFYTDAGIKPQFFGKVTHYPKRQIYEFWCEDYADASKWECASEDWRIPVRFNDAGEARMAGSIQWEMPLDMENLGKLHTKYGNWEAVQQQLIITVADKAVYMTGPLMSSRESYAERRNQLIDYVYDQIEGGVYLSTQEDIKVRDEMTGDEKTKTVAKIVVDEATGLPKRSESPQLSQFGIRTYNFTISDLDYHPKVQEQINQQQALNMQVQTAIAEAKEAEQRAITVEQQGKANAAQSRWEQEVIKAKMVTEAEQKRDVAELAKQEAGFYKQQQILMGEGEAARKRLVMEADGALKQKLETYERVAEVYATAIKDYKGQWVPTVVMGQDGQVPGGAANDLVQLLLTKTAMDLGLDLKIKAGRSTGDPQP